MIGPKEGSKKKHVHLWDIPKKYFPRKTKSKEYLEELLRLSVTLRLVNQKVQYSAQICAYNIRSINSHKNVPPKKEDLFREIREFDYHYENYCFRLHAYREKLLQFVNAILPVGYSDKEVAIKHILINPIVKSAGIVALIEKFQKDTSLAELISERTNLTHRLSSEKHDPYFRPTSDTKTSAKSFHKWCDKWRKEIETYADKTSASLKSLSDINNKLANKILMYKGSVIVHK